MISGALYHLVATYSVSTPLWSWVGSAILARPKSQIYRERGRMESFYICYCLFTLPIVNQLLKGVDVCLLKSLAYDLA